MPKKKKQEKLPDDDNITPLDLCSVAVNEDYVLETPLDLVIESEYKALVRAVREFLSHSEIESTGLDELIRDSYNRVGADTCLWVTHAFTTYSDKLRKDFDKEFRQTPYVDYRKVIKRCLNSFMHPNQDEQDDEDDEDEE